MKHILTYAVLGLVLLSAHVTTAIEVQKPTSLGEAILPHSTGIKPPKDHIWLYALRNGTAAEQVTFTFVNDGKKLERCQTDGTGRIDHRLEHPGDTAHIILLDNRYSFREITNAVGGEAYEASLTAPTPDTGTVTITDKTKEITLPGAGKVQISSYSGGVDGHGIYLRGTKPVFRYPYWSPRNINPGIDLQRGAPFNIIDGARKYEVIYQQLIPDKFSYLRYKLLRD